MFSRDATVVLVAGNMIDPPYAPARRPQVAALPHIQSILLPVGQGMKVSVKWSGGSAKL